MWVRGKGEGERDGEGDATGVSSQRGREGEAKRDWGEGIALV